MGTVCRAISFNNVSSSALGVRKNSLQSVTAILNRIGRWEVPASAPRLGAYLAFLWDLQMNVAVLLVLIGLRGGDGKTDVAIQFAQGQLRHLSHGGAALLDANEKICVRFF